MVRILIRLRDSLFLVFALGICFSSCKRDNLEQRLSIFRYNESAGISTLDPAYSKDQAIIWACNQIYNGLLQLDSNLDILPCIAKKYSISEDQKRYTFILRDDVYFHFDTNVFKQKRKVVAKDFVYSFNRILDPKTASTGAWIFSHIDKKEGRYCFYAPNDTTLIIELKEPFAPFLGLLTCSYAYVVPKEGVDYYQKDFATHPIGTGPFRFKYWKEGVKLVLLKNEHYFEKDQKGNSLPYLDAVNISFIVDKQSAFLEFIKGKIDFLSGIDPNYKDEILTSNGELKPKYCSKINLSKHSYLNTEYLGFYLDDKDKIVNNTLLRKAINYGFDRDKMIKYLRNNIGTPAKNGIIPIGLNGYDSNDNCYYYNPSLARQLIQQSGYYKHKPLVTLSTTSAYMDICKYIQQQLICLSVNVKLEIVPPAELRSRISEGKVNWFRGSWIADYPDAESYLSLFYSKNFSPNGPNYTHFYNKQYDLLYEQAIKEIDHKKRIALYKKMNKILIDNPPFVVLYYDEVLRFSHKNIHGLSNNAMNLLSLKSVYKTK